MVGANIASTYPLWVPRLLDKVRRYGRVIVVDPRGGRFVARTDLHLALKPEHRPHPGQRAAPGRGRPGPGGRHFVDERTAGFEEALAAAEPWTPHRRDTLFSPTTGPSPTC